MRFFFLIIPFQFFVGHAAAQELLVNGGLEEENICTEYKINCAPEGWISNTSGFNNYFRDPNRAHTGEHCMGIQAGHSYKPFVRTFIRSTLLCGLQKGKTYRLQFFIKSFHNVLDSAGVYFGPIDPLLERKPIHRLAPSIFLHEQNSFRRDSSWQPVTIDYLANGDERFITIASFARGDVQGPTGIDKENVFFLFVDDISLEPLDKNERLCANWQEIRDEIYEENERHEFLQRKIKHRRSNGPLNLPLQRTSVMIADTVTLPDVLFATGRRDLKKESFIFLDSFCRSLQGKKVDSLIIEGHTDNTGLDQLNDTLSLGRAQVVADHLLKCAYFFRVPVLVRGFSSRKPVAPNNTPAGRQRNRRVELLVYTREVAALP